ncbi:MAG: sulfite exporter TauE/SafE family protein [Candidatus Burarchaeum sp.]|nr:sulfite exporter TauE/SafE family protein [Candidatus Burarchaeum sp.]MDO8339568.1 sulfite exporter TauE/SafE family protein [Candidatus Burarchaeum sp.]
MDPILGLIVLVVSFFAAFIDVIVGGSSLIIVPALTILGIPIVTVIGTNRLYVTAFTLTGFLNYLHKKVPLDIKLIAGLIVVRVVGALIGSLSVLSIPTATVKPLVAIFMVFALAAIAFLHSRENKKIRPTAHRLILVAAAMLLVGFYEGFVGGGGGIITRVVLVLLLGYTMLEAALADLIMAFAASFASSIIFVLNGAVDYELLLPMLVGGVAGAFAGSHMALRKGEDWMRKLLYLVVIVLLLKMLFF